MGSLLGRVRREYRDDIEPLADPMQRGVPRFPGRGRVPTRPYPVLNRRDYGVSYFSVNAPEPE